MYKFDDHWHRKTRGSRRPLKSTNQRGSGGAGNENREQPEDKSIEKIEKTGRGRGERERKRRRSATGETRQTTHAGHMTPRGRAGKEDTLRVRLGPVRHRIRFQTQRNPSARKASNDMNERSINWERAAKSWLRDTRETPKRKCSIATDGTW